MMYCIIFVNTTFSQECHDGGLRRNATYSDAIRLASHDLRLGRHNED